MSPELTEIEMQTLKLMAEGLHDRVIAEQQNVSYEAIKSRTAHIRRKLDVRTRSGVVNAAYRLGLLAAPSDEKLLEQNFQLRRTNNGLRSMVNTLEGRLAKAEAEIERLKQVNQELGSKSSWLDSSQGKL